MKEFKIPENLVVFEDGGNKKTKKWFNFNLSLTNWR
jgi:hypothetical protein